MLLYAFMVALVERAIKSVVELIADRLMGQLRDRRRNTVRYGLARLRRRIDVPVVVGHGVPPEFLASRRLGPESNPRVRGRRP